MSSNIFDNESIKKNVDTVYSLSKSLYKNNKSDTDKINKIHKDLKEKIDLLLSSNDAKNREKYIQDINNMIRNPLFDMNNSQLFNKIWKNNSTYLLNYDEEVLNPIIKYVIEKNDDTLTNIFLQNGLIYVDKLMLCVSPYGHSHSAIILKFNKPIQFNNAKSDVAGILYSYSIKVRSNNSKMNFLNKFIHKLRQFLSLFWHKKAYMTRTVLTSDDFDKIEKHTGIDILKYRSVNGDIVENSVKLSFDAVKPIDKLVEKTNKDFSLLVSKIEKLSYYFSLYSKNNINYIKKDKIIGYCFNGSDVSLNISNCGDGISIYEFIATDCNKLNLTHQNKMSIIKKFLEIECLKLLKENKIIKKNATKFSFEDFKKLPNTQPNDLNQKFSYPKILNFDLNRSLKGKKFVKKETIAKAKEGSKVLFELENLNCKPKYYSFLNNNCLTVLKDILSDCNDEFKELIKNVDKESNWFQIRHPNSYFDKLQKSRSL